jgi:hypothetical protein
LQQIPAEILQFKDEFWQQVTCNFLIKLQERGNNNFIQK